MPEHRLQRTRDPQPEVPACVRLGHLWYFVAHNDTFVCRRCKLEQDARKIWAEDLQTRQN